jgi:hypothetical protein
MEQNLPLRADTVVYRAKRKEARFLPVLMNTTEPSEYTEHERYRLQKNRM